MNPKRVTFHKIGILPPSEKRANIGVYFHLAQIGCTIALSHLSQTFIYDNNNLLWFCLYELTLTLPGKHLVVET